MLNDGNNLWYKEAVFYEVHVRSYFDSNNDGIGDFKGLTEKLDYIKSIGIDCIWLLPFFESPLKDDGYDVSDYYSIHHDLGTMEDFEKFIKEAHDRNIRVIGDLVLNHVSDQHSWFVEARSSKNSKKRDWFVWTDDPSKYSDARIIFVDVEKSNWTFDQTSGQYYWHRFYSHQPDLNYDNPEVRDEIKNVFRFWLKKGMDGFRCDAAPYLYEREGVGYEGLPETHNFFKELRAIMDEEFPGCILLAEANQWPAESKKYFGNGDEFNMVFNFPLMPRIFVSLAKRSSYPIVNILNQINDIPENCSWGLFLRNHDELTLEMVDDEERDIMYKEYAKIPKMILNKGIRRRLAPLMDNDRHVIEMLHGILLSLPGSPILYYGDEINMGDNIYLGDRNGVRTPMQWSYDRNAGFSKCDPEQLYLPVIINPNYHYEVYNVEAMNRLPSSFLNWLRRIIIVRKQNSKVFGFGSIEILNCNNTEILAYIRSYQDQRVLCVFNVSRNPSYAALDLSKYSGHIVRDMIGLQRFPDIPEKEKYIITLPGSSFFWLKIE
ncbi:maltose alpha-D-glucosyltransferase [Caldiplasma sukawensis]